MARHIDIATFGIETAYKTPQSTLAPILLTDPQDLNPASGERAKRQYERSHSGNFESLKAWNHVTWNGKTEFNAPLSAGDPVLFDAWLQACGFARTVTAGAKVAYNPILDAVKSLSAQAFKDDDMHSLIGLRGAASWELAVGQIPKFSANFNGHHNGYAEQSLAAGTTITAGKQQPLLEDEVIATYAGQTLCFLSASGSMGTVVEHDASSCDNWDIVDHLPEMTLTAHKVGFSTKNFFQQADDDFVGPLSITWGKAGFQCRITAPAASLGQVGYAKQGKGHTLTLPLSLTPVNGNDEILLEMGDLT